MGDAPLLVHFRVSHYNEKVRWALDFKRWPHVRESVVPGFHVLRVRRLTGQNKTPVLVLDGKPLVGSSRILDEIERRRPEPPLFPDDPQQRDRALAIQRYFDDEVAPDLRRLLWSVYLQDGDASARLATDGASDLVRKLWRLAFPVMRRGVAFNVGAGARRVDRARKNLLGYFDRLASDVGASGYLAGDRFSVADLTAAAIMSAVLRPPEFSYPLPQPVPDALLELQASVADHDATCWVRDIYARHRGASSEIGG